MEMPANINIRSPLAIKRCHELVESGDARNYGEAADHLILIGYEQERRAGSPSDSTRTELEQPVANEPAT